MKKLILSILVVIVPLISIAQESKLKSFFDEYSGKDGYTSIYVSPFMFKLFAKIANEEEAKEFKDITSKINSIMLLTVSDSGSSVSAKFLDDLKVLFPNDDSYKELMVIKDGQETIRFLIKEKEDVISELVLTIISNEEPLLLFLNGNLDLNQIAKLSETMDIQGFEYLDKVDNNNASN